MEITLTCPSSSVHRRAGFLPLIRGRGSAKRQLPDRDTTGKQGRLPKAGRPPSHFADGETESHKGKVTVPGTKDQNFRALCLSLSFPDPATPAPPNHSPGLPWAVVVKNLPANAGDTRAKGSIPVLGRSPGEGNGNPLQYSCLKNPIDTQNPIPWGWGTIWGAPQAELKAESSSLVTTKCTLRYVKQIANGNLQYDLRNSYKGLEGWDGERGGRDV